MIGRIVAFTAAAMGGATGAQAPAVYMRYTHELGARIRQARDGLDSIAAYADRHDMAVHEALARLRAKGGVAEAAYTDLHETYITLKRLEPAYTAMTDAGPLTRPVAFARHLHADVLDAALTAFTPVLPLSGTGVAHALAGAVLALLAVRLGDILVRRATRAMTVRRP